MNCPSCDNTLTQIDANIELFACTKCLGIWFNLGQLNKVEWEHHTIANFIKDAPQREVEKLRCRHCDLPMHYNKYPTAPQVLAANCYGCNGSFLFDFQIREIRDHSMNEEQREAYLNQIASSVPGYLEAEILMKNNHGPQGFAKKWLDFKSKYLFFGKNK